MYLPVHVIQNRLVVQAGRGLMRRELFVIIVSSVCKCLRMLEEFALRALNTASHISSTVLICGVDGERTELSKVCALQLQSLNSRVPGREAMQLLTLRRAPLQEMTAWCRAGIACSDIRRGQSDVGRRYFPNKGSF